MFAETIPTRGSSPQQLAGLLASRGPKSVAAANGTAARQSANEPHRLEYHCSFSRRRGSTKSRAVFIQSGWLPAPEGSDLALRLL
jgi:hypothetical protein